MSSSEEHAKNVEFCPAADKSSESSLAPDDLTAHLQESPLETPATAFKTASRISSSILSAAIASTVLKEKQKQKRNKLKKKTITKLTFRRCFEGFPFVFH